jgi:hypothetical protein
MNSILLALTLASGVWSAPSAVGPDGTFRTALTGPGVFPSAEDFIFYVDPTGSDSNNCTAAITPCLTLQAAVAKLPPQWKQKARIIFAAGTYTITGVYNLRVGTPIGAGEPLVIQGAMEDSGLGERTITGVTTYGSGYVVSVTDNILAPTLDQYEGYFLRMTTCAAGAACVGLTRLIRGNSTGGQFEFNIGSDSSTIKPAVGDKFVIEKPSSIISYNNKFVISSIGNGAPTSSFQGSVIFNQLRFSSTASAAVLYIQGTTVHMKKVQHYSTSANGIYVINGGMLNTGNLTLLTSPEIMGDTPTYGASLYIYIPTSAYSNGGIWVVSSAMYGPVVLRNAAIFGFAAYSGAPGPNVNPTNVSIKGGHIRVNDQASVNVLASSSGPLSQIVDTSYATYPCIELGDVQATITGIELSRCVGGGVSLGRGGYVRLNSVTGTGNTGFGVRVKENATVYEGSGVTIAGTTSEVLVGTRTTTHAAIAAGTPLIVPPHGTISAFGGTTEYPLSGTNTGDVTLGAVGSTPNANGATLTGQVWNAQPADATYPGVVTVGAQTIMGPKTVTGPVSTNGLLSTALATPVNGTFTTGAGTLTTGTYYYAVTALNATGETVPSTRTSFAVTGPAGVNINWGTVSGATFYKIYGRSIGTNFLMATIAAPTVTWLDDGSVTPSGAMPSVGSSANISGANDITAAGKVIGTTGVAVPSGQKVCFDGPTTCSIYAYAASGYIQIKGSQLAPDSLRSMGAIEVVGNDGIKQVTADTQVFVVANDSSDGNARGVILRNAPSLSTAGDRLITGVNNATDAFDIDKDGSYHQITAPTLLTCAATFRHLKTAQVGASAGKYDKECMCVSDNQASPTYAWKNTSGIFATEAASIGDSTTCPDP